MKVRVVACQQPLHERLSEETLAAIRDADFVCLPEHYPLAQEIQNLDQAASLYAERKAYLAQISRQIRGTLIGGTLTEKTGQGYYNTCYVFRNGVEEGFYRKVYPTEGELRHGVIQGSEFKTFQLNGLRIGVLICADILNLKSIEELSSQKCRITFIPTASPYRAGETIDEKFERDRSIFWVASRRMNCPLVKTCGVGTTFGHRIQGRSLIVTPGGIFARAEPHQEHQQLLLSADLEIQTRKHKDTKL